MVEIYAMGKIPARLDQRLFGRGWRVIPTNRAVPDHVEVRTYLHDDVSSQRARKTRELLLQYIEICYSSKEFFAMMDELERETVPVLPWQQH